MFITYKHDKQPIKSSLARFHQICGVLHDFEPFAEFQNLKRNSNTKKMHKWCQIASRTSHILRFSERNLFKIFYVSRSIIAYIYHQITCDTTGKVTREVGEIWLRRYFSYFVSLGVYSKISLKNARTNIVNRNSDWFGFLKVIATCLNQWQTRAIKHTTSI